MQNARTITIPKPIVAPCNVFFLLYNSSKVNADSLLFFIKLALVVFSAYPISCPRSAKYIKL